MTVIIGIDPHKATHTAVAIGCDEAELATVTVRATRHQTDRLLGWAEPFEKRTWAIESVGGLGYLLAQQLVEGEHVLGVPATLASRVRVLGTGKSDKNDPNDARAFSLVRSGSWNSKRISGEGIRIASQEVSNSSRDELGAARMTEVQER
jgi:transposase